VTSGNAKFSQRNSSRASALHLSSGFAIIDSSFSCVVSCSCR
jgi:hypothetical protein